MEDNSFEKPLEEAPVDNKLIFDVPELDKAASAVVQRTEFTIDEGTAPTSYEEYDKSIMVHCCICGRLIEPNPANTCEICLSK